MISEDNSVSGYGVSVRIARIHSPARLGMMFSLFRSVAISIRRRHIDGVTSRGGGSIRMR